MVARPLLAGSLSLWFDCSSETLILRAPYQSVIGCRSRGEVPEWSNGAVSKTVVPLRVPRVRIPLSPPF